MFKVVVQAFFFAQALDEVQVGFVVLGAVDAFRVAGVELKTVGVALNAMFFQQAADDVLHGEVLEDALIGSVRQIAELGAQAEVVAGEAFAGFALGESVDKAVNTGTLAHVEIGGVVQQ